MEGRGEDSTINTSSRAIYSEFGPSGVSHQMVQSMALPLDVQFHGGNYFQNLMDPSTPNVPPSQALVRFQDLLAEGGSMSTIHASAGVDPMLEESHSVNLNLSYCQLSNELSHIHGGYSLEGNDYGEGPSGHSRLSNLIRAPEGVNRQLLMGESSRSTPQVGNPQRQVVAMRQTSGNIYVATSTGSWQNVNHLEPLGAGLMVGAGSVPFIHQPSTIVTPGLGAAAGMSSDLTIAALVEDYQRNAQFRSFLNQHGLMLANQANWSTVNPQVLSLTPPTMLSPFDHFPNPGFVVHQPHPLLPFEWQAVRYLNGITMFRTVVPSTSSYNMNEENASLHQGNSVNSLNGTIPLEVVMRSLAHFQNGSIWHVHQPFAPTEGLQSFMDVEYIQRLPQIINQIEAFWQARGLEPFGNGSVIHNTEVQLGGHPEWPVMPLTVSDMRSLRMSHVMTSQVRNVLTAMHWAGFLRFEDFMMMLGHPVVMNGAPTQVPVSDTLQDMPLDVGNMSYEEILALEDQMGYVNVGLPEETILSHLYKEEYRPTGSFTEDRPCCICLEEYVDGDSVTRLNCRHDFHYNCIKKWLMEKNACPMCKQKALNI